MDNKKNIFNLDKTIERLEEIVVNDDALFDMDKYIDESRVMENWTSMVAQFVSNKVAQAKGKETKRAQRMVKRSIEKVKKAYDNDMKRMLRVSALYFKKYASRPLLGGYVRFLLARKDNGYEEVNKEFYENFEVGDVYDFLDGKI
ncbi:MAG: hypothetical protein Q8P81_03705 [Nanoarchaeota archaeon]|nr:hypothetical protein [Nanoarchaeota archaeon]